MSRATGAAEPPTVSEYVFAVCVLFYSSSAFATLLKGSDELPLGISTGFFLTNLISAFSYLLGAYFLLTRCDLKVQFLRRVPWLVGVTLVPVVSVLWSDAPWITSLRAIGLMGTTVVGLYLGLRYDLASLLRLLGWSLGIAAVLSFFAGWLFPNYGTGSGVFEGDWIGVFAHKNTFGSVMALGFLVFLTLGRISQRWKILLWFICFLCLVLVFLANSATSMVGCTFLIIAIIYDRLLRPGARRSYLRFSIVVSSACLAALLTYVHFGDILGVLGRDENMTGRLVMWSLVWSMVQQRMLLGYGYGAFWLGYDGPSAEVWKAFGEGSFATAHNGYLEIWTGCGLVGVILFALCLIAALRKAFVHSRNSATAGCHWPLYLFLFLIIYNLSEATFLLMNHIFWLTFVAVVVQLSRSEGISMPEMLSLKRANAAMI